MNIVDENGNPQRVATIKDIEEIRGILDLMVDSQSALREAVNVLREIITSQKSTKIIP